MHTRFVIVALIGILNCSAKEDKGQYHPAIDVEEMATNIFNNSDVPNCLVSSELNLGNTKTNPYLTLKKMYEPNTNLSFIELSCQDNNQEITLNKEQFEIYSDGKLLDKVKNKIYDKSHYCLQLLRDNDERTMFWEARVCVSIFRVPRCCFNNLGVNKLRNICDENEKHKFDPPIRYLNNSAIITFEEKYVFNLECKNPDSVQSLEFRNGPIYLTHDQNGTLNFVSATVMSPKFCIGSNGKNDYFIQMCAQTESLNQNNFNCSSDICIRKCCPQNQIYDYSQNSCAYVNGSHNWEPTFFNHESHDNTTIPRNVSYMYGFPLCKKFFPLKPHENIDENFLVLDNGHLFVQKYKADYSSNYYCIDYFRKGGNTTEDSLLCFPEKEKGGGGLTDCNKIHSKIYPILMILSCVFLALTLIIYGILPDLYNKINGRCVMASTSALLLAYICFIIIIWSSATIPMTSCQLLGLFTQFFSLSSFFWLTVMCFDVWRALRSQRSVVGRPPQSVNKRFAKYSCFAWGCPLIISIVTAIMQFSKIKTSGGKPVVPGFGTSGCFFPSNDSRPSWAYFYGFISVLMAVNVGFFAHLLIMLFRERLQTDATLKRKNKRHLMWVKLYLKLFFVMGVTWIFEVISWVEGTCKLWIWTDSINALRGLLIFIIFVCKRDVMVKLKNKSILSSKRFNLSLMTSSSFENSKSTSVKQNSKFYVDIDIKEKFLPQPSRIHSRK